MKNKQNSVLGSFATLTLISGYRSHTTSIRWHLYFDAIPLIFLKKIFVSSVRFSCIYLKACSSAMASITKQLLPWILTTLSTSANFWIISMSFEFLCFHHTVLPSNVTRGDENGHKEYCSTSFRTTFVMDCNNTLNYFPKPYSPERVKASSVCIFT